MKGVMTIAGTCDHGQLKWCDFPMSPYELHGL
jgi:hypothetical protein